MINSKCEGRQLGEIDGDLSEKIGHMAGDSGPAALNGSVQIESRTQRVSETPSSSVSVAFGQSVHSHCCLALNLSMMMLKDDNS